MDELIRQRQVIGPQFASATAAGSPPSRLAAEAFFSSSSSISSKVISSKFANSHSCMILPKAYMQIYLRSETILRSVEPSQVSFSLPFVNANSETPFLLQINNAERSVLPLNPNTQRFQTVNQITRKSTSDRGDSGDKI